MCQKGMSLKVLKLKEAKNVLWHNIVILIVKTEWLQYYNTYRMNNWALLI